MGVPAAAKRIRCEFEAPRGAKGHAATADECAQLNPLPPAVSQLKLFDPCWIDAYPVTQTTTDLLYTAIAAEAVLPDSGPTVGQHNQSLGTAHDPATDFAGRMTALFPWPRAA